jgi:uncharacterized SAM-binding protein YcdF (DUF218 family)
MSAFEEIKLASVTSLVDAQAPGLGRADIAIVFGTSLPDPVPHAARLFHEGITPVIAVTGGTSRINPAHNEAERHAALLTAAGVPAGQLIIEPNSTHTLENVQFVCPLIEARLGSIQTAIVVVKWYHRRAVMILARHMPSLQRIYAVCYEPAAEDDRGQVTRANWPSTSGATRVWKEYRYILSMVDAGFDPLSRAGDGWLRTRP